jgi:DNA-binding response OmpR family regulator
MTKLLVVDDEPVIRNFLVRVLESAGYEVQAACDGREALGCLDAAPFDLLLSDIKMDHLDGVELLGEARSRYPDLAVILLTGHATVPSAIEALRRGAHDYLLKPVKNEDILAAVAAALDDRERQQRRDRLEALAGQMLDVLGTDPAPTPPDRAVIAAGPLQLDTAAYIATLDGARLDLTPTEFRLLAELSRDPGVTLDYVRLVEGACGYTCTRQEAREIIGTHVLNLRGKLGIAPGEPLYVESMRGVGYRLIPADEG